MLKRLSLTYKMLGLTVLAGLVVWFVLDLTLTGDIERIFKAQLNETLQRQAVEDRVEFDQYVRNHYEAVKLFASQKRLIDYVEHSREENRYASVHTPVIYRQTPPPWYPRMSVARALVQARVSMLLDESGRVLEVYAIGMPKIPAQLLEPSSLLMQLSHNQSLMTEIGGTPYVITSEKITGTDNSTDGILMLASPIDSEFLRSVAGHELHNSITALLDGSGKSVLVSSDTRLIPDGTDVASLEQEYVMTGSSFFDYGASDLRVMFATFVPTASVEEVSRTIVGRERVLRLITAIALIATFAVIMLWVTRHIGRVTDEIMTFSKDTLGVTISRPDTADEIMLLEQEFGELTREVMRAREDLKRETEDKLRLAQKAMAASLKERELGLLQSVMELLGIGIMSAGDGGYKGINPLMERFAEDCGGLDTFGESADVPWSVRRIVDREGDVRNFAISSLKTTDGGQYLLVQDVTEMKKVEETLRESEARVRAIADTAMDAIVTIDHEGLVTYWNPAAERMFGYTAEEMSGKDIHEILTPGKYQDAARKGMRHFLETGDGPAIGITRTLSSLRRDGTEFPIELSLSAFRREGRLNAVGVIRDISERVQAEEAKDAMFHMLTHDIKGPLSIIYGYCELIMLQELPQESAEMIQEMFKAAKRIADLIEDMLSLSRLESRTVELEYEKVSIVELAREAALDSDTRAAKMDVEITVDIHGDTPEVFADRKQLGRAIGNLVGNAVNYNKKGGKVVVRGGPEEEGGVWVSVSDTGAGIPEEDLPRIFDRYYRSRSTSTRHGTGLGLAIVKAAVESHGGTVTVESTQDEGTTFTVRLPLDAREAGS